jgi:hypothetical protein
MSSIDRHNYSIDQNGRNNQLAGERFNDPRASISAPDLEAQTHFVTRLNELISEHEDLDQAVASLLNTSGSDDRVIGRLKKRKLHLKDEISRAQLRLLGSRENAG